MGNSPRRRWAKNTNVSGHVVTRLPAGPVEAYVERVAYSHQRVVDTTIDEPQAVTPTFGYVGGSISVQEKEDAGERFKNLKAMFLKQLQQG